MPDEHADGKARDVLVRLGGHTGQGVPLGLGLDDADGAAVDEQGVVGLAGGEAELADGHAGRGTEVDLRTVLEQPSGRFEQLVDFEAGALFRFHRVPFQYQDDAAAGGAQGLWFA